MNNKNWKLYLHILPSSISGKENNMYYVGITSRSLNARWQNGRGYINNEHFYRAIQKYGWNNFIHELLFDNLSKDEANNLEKEYIQKYKSYDYNFGYNKALGGNSCSGYKWTEEARKNHLEALDQIKNTLSKSVYQFSDTFEFIKKFNSISDAAKEMNLGAANISYSALHGNMARGYIWVYEDNIQEINGEYKIKKIHNLFKDTSKHVIYMFDVNGVFKKAFASYKAASVYSGDSSSVISTASRKYFVTKNNWQWRIDKDVEEIDQNNFKIIKEGYNIVSPARPLAVYHYDDFGNCIGKYKSTTEASQKTGININTLRSYLYRNKNNDKAIWKRQLVLS